MSNPHISRIPTAPPRPRPKPVAVTWLNYQGDVTTNIEIGRPMGPNTLGEFLYVVDAHYDSTTDKTRVGLSYVRP